MIFYKTGDLLKSDAEALVNSVNCFGHMCGGIAKQFKNKFPDNFDAYALACKRGEVELGKMFVFERPIAANPKYIVNFPTIGQGFKSHISDLEKGLDNLIGVIQEKNIQSIAMPSLGCGVGGLDWNNVKNLIEKKLSCFDKVRIIVFEEKSKSDMMIAYQMGDLLKADTKAIVNPVNCVGVCGGLALQFQNKFPENYRAYVSACKRKEVKLGKMFVFENPSHIKPRYIINFPTKDHWANDSKLQHIKNGLDDLVKVIKIWRFDSLAIPLLGCGLGGLDWSEVKTLIEDKLQNLETNIVIFEGSDKAKQADWQKVGTPLPQRAKGKGFFQTVRRRLGI